MPAYGDRQFASDEMTADVIRGVTWEKRLHTGNDEQAARCAFWRSKAVD